MRMTRQESFKLKLAIEITNNRRLLINDKDEAVGPRRSIQKAMEKLGVDIIKIKMEDWKEWTLEQKQKYLNDCLYELDF